MNKSRTIYWRTDGVGLKLPVWINITTVSIFFWRSATGGLGPCFNKGLLPAAVKEKRKATGSTYLSVLILFLFLFLL